MSDIFLTSSISLMLFTIFFFLLLLLFGWLRMSFLSQKLADRSPELLDFHKDLVSLEVASKVALSNILVLISKRGKVKMKFCLSRNADSVILNCLLLFPADTIEISS